MEKLATSRSHEELTDEQKRILNEKRVSGSRTPTQWFELLLPLARFDSQGDRLRRRATTVISSALVITFITVVVSVVSESAEVLVILPFSIIAVIIGWVVVSKTSSRDIANHLQEFVLPLLALLEDDIRGEVTLEIDLHEGITKEKISGAKPRYRDQGGRYDVIETHFIDPWLNGSARLVDGSRLQWRVTDHLRALKKTRRIGKRKVKYKYKARSLLELDLKLPSDQYRVAGGNPASAQGKLKVTSKERWHTLRARRMVKREGWLGGADPSPLSVEPFAELITALYRRAATPQTVAAKGAN